MSCSLGLVSLFSNKSWPSGESMIRLLSSFLICICRVKVIWVSDSVSCGF